jgi:hypothetical protein
LYVEGKLRYESKHVAHALTAAKRFIVDRRVLLQPLRLQESPPFGEKLEEWLPYHVILFGDVSASHFTTAQLRIIRELVVEYGKGFCMIGGTRSFGPGGWGDTPIADVLPIDVDKSREQIKAQIKVTPTSDARTSDIMRISEDDLDVLKTWETLAPLPGANRLVGVKPGATVLATSPTGDPLIVAQQYGKGRALAIAFDQTWRWVLAPKDTRELQKRFWRQVALYLAAPKGHVWITTDRTTYDLRRLKTGADVIHVTAGVEDASGIPVPDAPVEVTLDGPDGHRRPIRLQSDGRLRRTELRQLSASGLYTLRISAQLDGKQLTGEQQFEVIMRDLEAQDILANPDLLRRMAQLSNGQFVELAAMGELLEKVRVSGLPTFRDVAVQRDLSRYLRWPIVAVLIALLCVEWGTRKRRGLV